MNLTIFRANGDFSQSNLSIFGNPNVETFGWRACLSPSWRKPTGELRSHRKCERPLASPPCYMAGKIDLSEKIGRFVYNGIPKFLTITLPQYCGPSPKTIPRFFATKVTVLSALTQQPKIFPVVASKPEGISMDKIFASDALIISIKSLKIPFTSPSSPTPKLIIYSSCFMAFRSYY